MKKVLVISGHTDLATSVANKTILDTIGQYLPETEIVKLEKVTKKMTDEQKSKYDELKPLIEYATQKSGEINNALNDAQSLCDQKMYYEASQTLDKIATDYKLPPTEQKKFDEEKTTAENGIKSVKITDALKNVETIYNGGDYDKATEELSKIDTSNLTDAQSQKYQSLQTNIANAKAAAEKAAAEKAAAEAKAQQGISQSQAENLVLNTFDRSDGVELKCSVYDQSSSCYYVRVFWHNDYTDRYNLVGDYIVDRFTGAVTKN